MQAIDERVPGDVSAAAFWLVARRDPPRRRADPPRASASTRPAAAIIDLLRAMGADIEERLGVTGAAAAGRRRRRRAVGRPDRPLRPTCTRIDSRRPRSPRPSTRSPSCAWPRPGPDGTTTIRGAGELRHKESDRIAGHRRRPAGARRARRGRRRRPAHPRRRAAARRADRQPRRPPPGDDLRHRRPRRRAARPPIERPGSAAISYPGFFDDLERVRA